MAHNEVMAMKADLTALGKNVKENLIMKADAKDILELRAQSRELKAESQQAQKALKEANDSLAKFDAVGKEVEGIKVQMQELVKLFKDECMEIRDWTRNALADLR